MFDKLEIKTSVPVVLILWIWLILALIVAILIFYSFDSQHFNTRFIEASKFFLLVSGAGFVAFTAYCQWKTSLLNLKFLEENQKLEKKKVSLQLLAKWDSDQFKEKRNFYRNTRRKRCKLTDEQLVDEVEGNEMHRNSLLDIANFFEDVEQSIRHNIADEKILQDGFKPLVISIRETYEPWFEMLKNTDKKYYAQFGPFFNLLEKWR